MQQPLENSNQPGPYLPASSAPKAQANWSSGTHRRRRAFRRAISLSHHLNLWLGRKFPDTFPFVVVFGYPKSGTSWISQLLADCLYLPYPQHAILPLSFACILQTHARVYAEYRRSAYVIRDGRDVMVSLYFHLAANMSADASSAPRYRRIQGLGPATEIHRRLPEFIAGQARRPFSTRVNWGDHVSAHFAIHGNEMPLLHYENLRRGDTSELSSAATILGGSKVPDEAIAQACDRFSFQRLSGRSPGQEDRSSYLRKGKIGDWKEYFTPESAQSFHQYFGKALITSGYEKDAQWIDHLDRKRAA